MDLRLLALAVLACAALPASAQSADLSTDARAFVTQLYFEGVPYDHARALGKEALPDLYAVLADPSLEAYWVNTVGTIGYIGSPDSVEPLMAFLRGFEGEVSVHAFRAALQVMPALGSIHGAGSEAALDVLVAFSDDAHWQVEPLGLRYGGYEGEALGEVLGRMAVMGLGWSGTEAATAHLESLRPGLRADWTDNVDEALTLNARIRAQGAEAVFAPSGR